ncbi:uncharacterized protein LY89DRAFT_667709 [Mollisia scopiformis]|uniref:DUF6604 domain-containing protein n=1 Tax=Mollisia scopiformis TaxID=149040 RepID=A0A194XFT2_MOLSC|nr:uncharacterized protein LY89DRAFT_667709 [Mollisia scopiformis]KUJ18632.1 hypothetical protein LY89DRAFT_667709 [Mollisia scopiformis]
MLPTNLAASYVRYKTDTNTFVSWLNATAISCGHKTPFVADENEPITITKAKVEPIAATGKLKGKARKEAQAKGEANAKAEKEAKLEAKTKQRQVISTAQVLKQAKIIVASPMKISVPLYIQTLLRQAIQARKRCTQWFTTVVAEDKHSVGDLGKRNQSHEHFIRVLEEAFDILKPCFEMPKITKTRNASVADEMADNINSQFEKIDADADLPLTVFCFYEDIHVLRGIIVETWILVADGKLNYKVAALITNVALELVAKAERELVQQFPSVGGCTYTSITSTIYPVRFFETRSPAKVPSSAEAMKDVEEGLGKVLNTGGDEDSAGNGEGPGTSLDRRPETQESTMTMDDFVLTYIFHSLEKCHTMITFTGNLSPMVMPIMFFYGKEPELIPMGSNTSIEDERLSLIMLDIEINKVPVARRKAMEDARRSDTLDQSKLQECRSEPVHDEITKALDEAREPGELKISQVVAARALLDILDVVGYDRGHEFYEDLLTTASRADARLGITWTTDVENSQSRIEQDDHELLATWGHVDAVNAAVLLSWRVNTVIKRPDLVLYKHIERRESFSEDFDNWSPDVMAYLEELGVEPKKLVPSPDPLFLFRHQPVYSGLESLRMDVELHQIGTNLANDFLSFTTMAHLYNALQLSKKVYSRWPLMDQAIGANISRVFNGSLPTTLKQCATRFLVLLGVPLKYLSPTNRHNPNFLAIVRKQKVSIEALDMSKHLQGYFAGHDSGEKLLFNVRRSQKSEVTKRSDPNHGELLIDLRDRMQESIAALQFDMISLVRSCNALFQTIRSNSKSLAGAPQQELEEIGGGVIPICNHIIVLEILDELQTMQAHKGWTANSTEGIRKKPVFVVASETIEDFLQNGNREAKVEPFDVLASMED